MSSMTDEYRTCSRCGVAGRIGTDFGMRTSGKARSWCRRCEVARVRQAEARRRERMGEAAWREHRRAVVARSRQRRDMDRERIYSRAARRATRALIDAHRGEYEHRLAVELALAEQEEVA